MNVYEEKWMHDVYIYTPYTHIETTNKLQEFKLRHFGVEAHGWFQWTCMHCVRTHACIMYIMYKLVYTIYIHIFIYGYACKLIKNWVLIVCAPHQNIRSWKIFSHQNVSSCVSWGGCGLLGNVDHRVHDLFFCCLLIFGGSHTYHTFE